jgi:hypothetical protein
LIFVHQGLVGLGRLPRRVGGKRPSQRFHDFPAKFPGGGRKVQSAPSVGLAASGFDQSTKFGEKGFAQGALRCSLPAWGMPNDLIEFDQLHEII